MLLLVILEEVLKKQLLILFKFLEETTETQDYSRLLKNQQQEHTGK